MLKENKTKKINFNDLNNQWKLIKENALGRINNIFANSDFIGGKDIESFEKNFASWNNNRFAIGCSNGTDAIKLSIKALDLKGKIVIYMPSNTFIATISAAEQAYPNAEFILIDCDDNYQIDVNLLRDSLNNHRERFNHAIILPVHLYGHTVDINNIKKIANDFSCYIIEDSSQAHGAIGEDGIKTGTFGTLSAFSLYPGKNLGAAGDAGVITTNDESIYYKIKAMRNHGALNKYFHEYKGSNNRLDSIQAVVVDEKLKFIDSWNLKRNEVAKSYNKKITNERVLLPSNAQYCTFHVYHIYCVRIEKGKRNEFQKHLKENGIPSIIHYPIPIEMTKAYSYLNVYSEKTRKWMNEIVSLPIHPFLKEDEIEHICSIINKWEG